MYMLKYYVNIIIWNIMYVMYNEKNTIFFLIFWAKIQLDWSINIQIYKQIDRNIFGYPYIL